MQGGFVLDNVDDSELEMYFDGLVFDDNGETFDLIPSCPVPILSTPTRNLLEVETHDDPPNIFNLNIIKHNPELRSRRSRSLLPCSPVNPKEAEQSGHALSMDEVREIFRRQRVLSSIMFEKGEDSGSHKRSRISEEKDDNSFQFSFMRTNNAANEFTDTGSLSIIRNDIIVSPKEGGYDITMNATFSVTPVSSVTSIPPLPYSQEERQRAISRYLSKRSKRTWYRFYPDHKARRIAALERCRENGKFASTKVDKPNYNYNQKIKSKRDSWTTDSSSSRYNTRGSFKYTTPEINNKNNNFNVTQNENQNLNSALNSYDLCMNSLDQVGCDVSAVSVHH